MKKFVLKETYLFCCADCIGFGLFMFNNRC